MTCLVLITDDTEKMHFAIGCVVMYQRCSQFNLVGHALCMRLSHTFMTASAEQTKRKASSILLHTALIHRLYPASDFKEKAMLLDITGSLQTH